MGLFSKDYHPLDSRHTENRVRDKQLKKIRDSQTRSGERKMGTGGMSSRPAKTKLIEKLTVVESTAPLEIETQTHRKTTSPQRARRKAEREYWKGRGILSRFGVKGVLHQTFAFLAGDKAHDEAKGVPMWLRVVKYPLAVACYFILMKVGPDFVSFTSETAGLTSSLFTTH